MSWWRKSWSVVIVIRNGWVHWRILNHQIIDGVHVLSYHLLYTLFRLRRRSISTSDTTLPRMSWFGWIYFLRPMCWINGPIKSWSSLLKVFWTQHPIDLREQHSDEKILVFSHSVKYLKQLFKDLKAATSAVGSRVEYAPKLLIGEMLLRDRNAVVKAIS